MFSVNEAVDRNELTKNCHMTLQFLSSSPRSLLASVFWFYGLQCYPSDSLSSTDQSDSELTVEL